MHRGKVKHGDPREMILHREGDRFVLECTYGDRSTPKEARFHWDPKAKQWWTNQPERAACLIDYADEACQAVLVEARQQHEEALKASRATDAFLEVSVPAGLEFMPFQSCRDRLCPGACWRPAGRRDGPGKNHTGPGDGKRRPQHRARPHRGSQRLSCAADTASPRQR